MNHFCKWIIKEYVYMTGYLLASIVLIMGIISTNILLLILSITMFLGISSNVRKEWLKIIKRYEKIHNKKKLS